MQLYNVRLAALELEHVDLAKHKSTQNQRLIVAMERVPISHEKRQTL